MFYHVVVETTEKEKKSGKNIRYFEFDRPDLSEIENKIVKPYLSKNDFQFNGYFLKPTEIRRLLIKETNRPAQEIADFETERLPANVFAFITREMVAVGDKYSKDITREVLERIQASPAEKASSPPITNELDLSKIFIVHGRDDLAKTETARFVEKLGFTAIILHEQPSLGKTIIEKIEAHTNVGFAIILYTPCDIGGLAGEEPKKPRARQNVVFEHGYLIAKLGRKKVCALVKSGTEVPNDISGVVYVPLDDHGAWHLLLAKELRAAGYPIDMNKI